ncbi:DUF3299 domain-containing protein [Planctomycetes bacterium K23_9]|uniref:DUF3299 domain-containing protein n=1 Tax=Stieleria marina TaxID=1930275 RepID=A0A517NLZ3_9BACT|nr:hypothetical protein K239x_00220 [Planctomycetes bacterium K23_9]
MSAELQMSAAADEADFPYRAISRAAIASVVFTVFALPGLVPTFEPMLFLAVIAIVAALVAMRAVKRYPDEYSGRAIALFSLIASLAILVGGVSMHTYIYLTEVPDGYERVPFFELQQPSDAKIDAPTELAYDIDGKPVFIKGYIHPSSGGGVLRQFILVPDLGTCCFGGQPKSTDMIEVTLLGGKTVKAGLTRRKLAGKFQLNSAPQVVTDFDNNVFYRLRVDQIK